MNTETQSLLIEKAKEAREKAYAPYSGFSVGAALLCADGAVYTGANIENASYTPTVCAERVAFFSAVHDGHREFTAIAIVGGKSGEDIDEMCPPCGVCRQVISEFCKGDFNIIFSNGKADRVLTLDGLLPYRFSL
ncbi:MAG: cytidine deaminase [Ruminococcaceae bacterium]|nr:cytidine deaminase [Oscillospiraceae bacterium]